MDTNFKGIPIVQPVRVPSGAKFRTEHGVAAIKNGVKQNPRAEAAPHGRKPPWLRAKMPSGEGFSKVKQNVREHRLATVCEESMCPNIGECWNNGTATLMIMGAVCTRACQFCAVDTGNPRGWLDAEEPANSARSVQLMGLRYVVITSVDRDDLRDGGAAHFAECIDRVRELNPGIRVEILVPDFRGRNKIDRALEILAASPPDVFNHNIETVLPLYRNVRPGADYHWSLQLLQRFKAQHADIPTKSGIMLGLGETREQVEEALRDLRAHDVDMVTIGQYLQPTPHHHPVMRYWTPEEFDDLAEYGYRLGFSHVASGPLVRSSYHADVSAEEAGLV